MFTGIVSHIGIVNKISHPDDWELSVDVINDNNSDNDLTFEYFLDKNNKLYIEIMCISYAN